MKPFKKSLNLDVLNVIQATYDASPSLIASESSLFYIIVQLCAAELSKISLYDKQGFVS